MPITISQGATPNSTVVRGPQSAASVEDRAAQTLLTGVLRELKKTNIYLAQASDHVIDNLDVEV
jgi:hypothetical protein